METELSKLSDNFQNAIEILDRLLEFEEREVCERLDRAFKTRKIYRVSNLDNFLNGEFQFYIYFEDFRVRIVLSIMWHECFVYLRFDTPEDEQKLTKEEMKDLEYMFSWMKIESHVHDFFISKEFEKYYELKMFFQKELFPGMLIL